MKGAHSIWLPCVAALFLAAATPARAQWTSVYPNVNVAGTFNGFDTLNPNMVLISNGVWQSYAVFNAYTQNLAFLFSTPNFTQRTWKATNQTDYIVPIIAGSGAHNVGNDIVVSNFTSGILRFELNENTGVYKVEDVTPGSAAGDVWINEIHYDNVSTDTNEFIEVAGMAGTVLTNYQLVLYNGGNGLSYNTRTLSGTITNQQNGFGAVAFTYPTDGIQNGAPDGVALVKNLTNVLLFLSYEGGMVASNGPANGMTSVDIGVQENAGAIGESLQLIGSGGNYFSFTWTGPAAESPGQLNVGQTIATGSPAVSVTFSNLTITPSLVSTGQSVHVSVNIHPINGATNIFAATFYRVNGLGRFLPLPMSRTGTLHQTLNPIPAQSSSATVEYYIFASFTGAGTNSPSYFPVGAPVTNIPKYNVSGSGIGQIWVNEVNASNAEISGGCTPDPEPDFIELAGVAGLSVSGWKIEVYSVENNPPDRTFVVPSNTVFGNESNGFGFYVLGDTNTPNVDYAWTNDINILGAIGGIKVYNEFGDQLYALYWDDSGLSTTWTNFQNIGFDAGNFDCGGFSLGGSGGSYSSFTWSSPTPLTPGASNSFQTLTGGNTNTLPPLIVCPTNILLSCPSSPIPAPNTNLVTASSLCGGGVVVSWVSDTTNTGTGCFGNPKIVTRTYRAVASSCGLTSTCQQLIILEDVLPPVITCTLAELVNPGFELGDFTGWSIYGAVSTNVSVVSVQPQSGFRHAWVRGSFGGLMADSSGNDLDGFYLNGPLREQPPAKTATTFAVFFDGVNDYAEAPNNSLVNGQDFAFALWTRFPTTTPFSGGVLLASREFNISEVSGYQLVANTNRQLEFWTADGGFWHVLTTSNQMPVGSYFHVAASLDFDGTNALKQLWVTNTLAATGTAPGFQPNTTRPLRLAAGTTETGPSQFFRGQLDDVRFYNAPLTTGQVATLWNSGNGGTGLGTETAHYRLDDAADAAAGEVLPNPDTDNGPFPASLRGYWKFNATTGTNATNSAATASTNNGTLVNGPVWTNRALFGNALWFDGTNDHVTVNDNATMRLGNTHTIEFWVYPTRYPTNTARIVSKGTNQTINYSVALKSNGQVEYQFRVGNGDLPTVTSAAALPTNQWSHVACTYNGSNLRVYINGQENATLFSGRNVVITSTRPLRFGQGGDAEAAYAGVLEDLRIYNVTRSAAEILASFERIYDVALSPVAASGLRQGLPAGTGQTWTASAWALVPASDPLVGYNRVAVELDYLNATGGVLAVYTSSVLSASSPVGQYIKLTARGPAPLNTVTARLSTVFRRDASATGSVYFDDAVLTTLELIASNGCPVMPNLLSFANATDNCGTPVITQSPAPGATVTATNTLVTFTATDACGLQSSCSKPLTVIDVTPPTIVCPVAVTSSCLASIPAPNPGGIVANDNCGTATVTFEGDSVSGGAGCPGDPRFVTRTYRATDLAGNTTTCVQQITIVDTNAPEMSCTLPAPLTNAGFESGIGLGFTGWTTFGNNKFVVTTQPRSGLRHARVYGAGGMGENFTGFFQDLPASSGQTWRVAGWVSTPATNPISGGNTAEVKVEFLGPGGLISSHAALVTSSNLPAGSYKSFAASGVAPVGATVARMVFVYVQRSGAAGEVYLDDVSLSVTELSATGAACQAVMPDYRAVLSATDCGEVELTQTPLPGTMVGLGTTLVSVVATDGCGLTRTCTVSVVAMDDGCSATFPAPTQVSVVGVSLNATSLTVRSVGTNTWLVRPEYTTNLMGAPQTWLPILSWTNTYQTGTNITTFQPPVTNTPVLYRIWQDHP